MTERERRRVEERTEVIRLIKEEMRQASMLRWENYPKLEALIDLIEEYADHQSVRCAWPAGYEQWKDGDCACGLVAALRDAGLPVDWAGTGPPE